MDAVEYLMQNVDFRKYDKPEKAQKMISEYFSEQVNVTGSLIIAVADAITCNKKCGDLDCALNSLFLFHCAMPPCSDYQFRTRNNGPVDDDNGYWNVARKQYEEKTCHGCY